MEIQVGDMIQIIYMEDEPQYSGLVGKVTHIDDFGQIHGTWGGCAIIPAIDIYKKIEEHEYDYFR